MLEVEIRNVPPNHANLLPLIVELDLDLLERYPAEVIHRIDFNEPNINQILFAVAYYQDQPVGCGALRPYSQEITELKRFFVKLAYRKQGIAFQLLSFLEQQAVKLGYRTIRLEAGAMQPEALQFYQKHGYTGIDRFGEYVHCEESLCYEKHLMI
jgi:putative acetyltransferase